MTSCVDIPNLVRLYAIQAPNSCAPHLTHLRGTGGHERNRSVSRRARQPETQPSYELRRATAARTGDRHGNRSADEQGRADTNPDPEAAVAAVIGRGRRGLLRVAACTGAACGRGSLGRRRLGELSRS